ncbi:MAG: PA14 domain-containing protein [Rhizobacter sp.]
MAPPLRYALLRDGPVWACALPSTAVVADDDSLTLIPGATSATIESGRLDAGIDSDWERVAVQALASKGSSIVLYTFTSGDANATPVWRREPGLNILLDRDAAPAPKKPATHRYLWLRIQLNSTEGITRPALRQVQAQTLGRNDIEDLPALYRRDDQDKRFLHRWLALFGADRQGFEQALADVPALFDPRMAPADQLDWVAQCLGFEPPHDITPAQLRELLQDVPALYARRGTVAGLEDWAEVYSGLRPKIIEAYRARRVWQLGSTSCLGFDTQLPAGTPDGLVVPGTALTAPAYLGLLRETFGGPAFDWINGSLHIDGSIAFTEVPLALDPVNAQNASVGVSTLRWSGQIQPRHPERYTLSLRLDGAVATDDIRARLWIDGIPLIDDWADAGANQSPNRPSLSLDVQLRMEERRWYPLRLEVRTTSSKLKASFSWSSRSQRPEIVPSACLYALTDERADTSRTQASGFDVGSAVVGESGPQTPGDFGQGLFSETAHLFTVLVPPRCDCGPGHNPRHQRLREAIDAEKPAHTDYHLCFLKPRMRVGFQARLGIDAIVANGPPPARLEEASLGRNSFLAADSTETQQPDHISPPENAPWTR